MTGPSPLSLLKSITKVDIKKHRATIPQRTLPKRNPQLINFCLNINLPFFKEIRYFCAFDNKPSTQISHQKRSRCKMQRSIPQARIRLTNYLPFVRLSKFSQSNIGKSARLCGFSESAI